MHEDPNTKGPPATDDSAGVVAFSAFHLSLGHGSTAENWRALPVDVRAAWLAAARAAIAHATLTVNVKVSS